MEYFISSVCRVSFTSFDFLGFGLSIGWALADECCLSYFILNLALALANVVAGFTSKVIFTVPVRYYPWTGFYTYSNFWYGSV